MHWNPFWYKLLIFWGWAVGGFPNLLHGRIWLSVTNTAGLGRVKPIMWDHNVGTNSQGQGNCSHCRHTLLCNSWVLKAAGSFLSSLPQRLTPMPGAQPELFSKRFKAPKILSFPSLISRSVSCGSFFLPVFQEKTFPDRMKLFTLVQISFPSHKFCYFVSPIILSPLPSISYSPSVLSVCKRAQLFCCLNHF